MWSLAHSLYALLFWVDTNKNYWLVNAESSVTELNCYKFGLLNQCDLEGNMLAICTKLAIEPNLIARNIPAQE